MKLESQVVSLEIAKRLKELGVKQESLFYWFDCVSFNGTGGGCEPYVSDIKREAIPVCSAFTVAELGEMLPRYVKDTWELSVCKFMGKWEVRYEESVSSTEWLSELQNTLANAMGLMLIYLLENKLLTY